MTTWLINLCSVTPSVSNSTGCEEVAYVTGIPPKEVLSFFVAVCLSRLLVMKELICHFCS